jgi:hypothetical protein
MFGVSYPWCRFPGADFVLPSTTPSQFDPQAYLASLELLGSYSPQRMYLTHYSELEFSVQKLQLLARQIKAYCVHAEADPGDATALQRRLTHYTLELLSEFDSSGDVAERERQIAFDMQLNAQGLQIWQQRGASE